MTARSTIGQIALRATQVDCAEAWFRVEHIDARFAELTARDVAFDDQPHLFARMPDPELWMVFFKEPDGNQFALMEERR